jgi:histidine phosphotransferase ChpT
MTDTPEEPTGTSALVGDDAARLASLVGSRICHDLISPIGAIGNGLELLTLSGVPASPEMTLLADSVAAATARVRFFRIAYGADSDTPIALREVAGILADLGRSGRLAVDWTLTEPQPRAQVRRALLAVQCLEAALPSGGQVRVSHNPAGTWRIEGWGKRLRPDPEAWAVLSGQSVAILPPGQVQFLLLARLIAGDGRRLGIAISEEQIAISY